MGKRISLDLPKSDQRDKDRNGDLLRSAENRDCGRGAAEVMEGFSCHRSDEAGSRVDSWEEGIAWIRLVE